MEVVALLDYAAPDARLRQGLLDRAGALALAGRGRLDFVAADRDAAREIVAIGFASASFCEASLARWRAEGALPETVTVRLLSVEAVRSSDALAPMFP